MASRLSLVSVLIASFCPIVLCLCSSQYTFKEQPVCPSESDRARLPSLSSLPACLMRCAKVGTANCSAVFSMDSSECWMARPDQWQDIWQASSYGWCRSMVLTPRTPLPDGLRLWFNFRFSERNLAVGAFASLQAHMINAQRNLSGAVLNDSGYSYIAIPTAQGFESIVGPSSSFTYFVRAERVLKNTTYYIRASDSAGSSGKVYVMEEFGALLVGNNAVNSRRFDTAAIVDKSRQRTMVSIGVIYNGFSFSVFYNGVIYPTSLSTTSMGTGGGASDLRLGFRHNDYTKALSGRFLCFGVWIRELSLSELQSLELEC